MLKQYNWTWGNDTVLVNWDPWNITSPACDFSIIFPNGYLLATPITVPFSILAMLGGILLGSKIRATGNPGSRVYSLSYFFFAVMMSCAMFSDTFLLGYSFTNNYPFYKMVYLCFYLTDMVLTSSIATSFAFNALVDIGLLDENSPKIWKAMISMYSLLFILWFIALFLPLYFPSFFLSKYCDALANFLYNDVIGFCGVIYGTTQLYLIVLRENLTGFAWLFTAGIPGVIGFIGVLGEYPVTLCSLVSPYVGNTGVWFMGADFAMFFLFKYFMNK